MTLTDGLLLVIAVAVLIIAVQLLRLVGSVSKAADKLEELWNAFEDARPELLRTVREAHEVLAGLRDTIGRIDGIAETVEEGAALARRLRFSFARLAAVVTAAKAGFEVLRRGGSHHGNGAVAARGGSK